jgi:hypothetical protein
VHFGGPEFLVEIGTEGEHEWGELGNCFLGGGWPLL